jgi:hypothetical protein
LTQQQVAGTHAVAAQHWTDHMAARASAAAVSAACCASTAAAALLFGKQQQQQQGPAHSKPKSRVHTNGGHEQSIKPQ